jgi:hypothetical protein
MTQCTEEGCPGTIDAGTQISMRVSCIEFNPTNPCSVCGRLHWPSGHPVFNRPGQSVFFKNGGFEYKTPPQTTH